MSMFYLGLGSNQGDRLNNLAKAVSELGNCGEVQELSSIYETVAKFKEDQPKFLNMVCSIESELAAVELFEAVKSIEQLLGRVATERNGPRVIDIDLLFCPDESFEDENLKLPHRGLAERAFVLVPFAEIAPQVFIESKSVAEMLAQLDQKLVQEVEVFRKELPRL